MDLRFSDSRTAGFAPNDLDVVIVGAAQPSDSVAAMELHGPLCRFVRDGDAKLHPRVLAEDGR